ncbi:MAG: HAD family hydrolase [Clostridia bacterium]|nr:HAD family hydrolase [Clostridia bacterium]
MKAILFDMDGTLLPMDEDVFTKGYFKLLAKKLCPFGIEPEALIDAVWDGTKCMYKNDGTKTNEQVFWDRFGKKTDLDYKPFYDASNDFYPNEFHEAKAFAGENPLARVAVAIAHEKADKVVLATNPLFPLTGQEARMSWMGLTKDDFDFVTSYENSSFTKPNPKYFEFVCDTIGVEPEDCVMIGNSEDEDMHAAAALGIDTFLVEGFVKPSRVKPYEGKRGSFEDMIEFLKSL